MRHLIPPSLFRSRFVLASLLLGCLQNPCPRAAPSEKPAALKKPNVILILADDLGWGDLGCYGQKRIRTPALDQMAAQGIRFTHAYAGSTVCAPSRCVLMTGLHTGHSRIRGNARVPLESEDVTVAEVLQGRGYATALIGKWGLGEAGSPGTPNLQGFDYFFGYLNQHHAHNYYPAFLWRNDQKVALRNRVAHEDAQGGGRAERRLDYSHDLFVEEALDFVDRNKGTPFFLYLALTIPHANNEAKDAGMEVPDLAPYTDEPWPDPQKAHAAMITRMDRDLGRLFEHLQKLGLDNDTVVFFSSDNGPHREGGNDPEFNDSNGPFRGIKRDLYEGGIRVPLLVRWPGVIAAGTTSEEPCSLADLLPTLAQIAHAKTPARLDGASLLPLLLGKSQHVPERYLYWEFHERGFKQAARQGRWKAVRTARDMPLELFDLAADDAESQNQAALHPEITARFEEYFKRARSESPHWPIK